MSKVESSYKKVCETFGEDKVSERASFLYNKIKSFITASEAVDFAIIHQNSLCHMVIDYFDDISRLKDYHSIEKTNKEKIIAYTSFWLNQRKPIQMISERTSPDFDFINEAFITTYIVDEICALPHVLHITDDYKRHLFYHLKYRLTTPQSVELMLKPFFEKSYIK